MNKEVSLTLERERADLKSAADRTRLRSFISPLEPGPGDQEKAAKSQPVPVHHDMSVAEAFETVVQSCIQHFRSNEPLVSRRRDPDALHQVRVAMRRLRAAFSLFRPALADPQFENLRQEVRWFTRQLGEARNLDVLLQERGLARPLRKSLKKERDEAYDQVVDALSSKRLRLLQIDLLSWIELGRWHHSRKAMRPLPDFTARRLYKWWRMIEHHHDLHSMRTQERHQLRIEIKKLRYALEFVQPLHVQAGGKHKHFYRAVERIQESLGRLNDLANSQTIARKLGHKPPRSKGEVREIEGKCLAAAQTSLDRLKKIGPYWTKLS